MRLCVIEKERIREVCVRLCTIEKTAKKVMRQGFAVRVL